MKYSVSKECTASRKEEILLKRQSRKKSVGKNDNTCKNSETIIRWWWLKEFNKEVRDTSKRSRGKSMNRNPEN